MTVRPVGRTSTGERELRVQGAQACAPRAARSNAPVTVVLMPRTSRSKPFGPCSLCKQERQLTFEHIPPQAAGNTDPVWAQNMDQWLSAGPAYARKGQPGGRQQQRGAGGHLLCGECNSLLGTTLVPNTRDGQVQSAMPLSRQRSWSIGQTGSRNSRWSKSGGRVAVRECSLGRRSRCA